jgi:hypothetical protein
MNPRLQGAIDCDVHPSVPGIAALLPYLDDYWRDMNCVYDVQQIDEGLEAAMCSAVNAPRPRSSGRSG